MTTPRNHSPRVLILGGGFAGITAMQNLKSALGDKINVIMCDNRQTSLNKPRLPEVAMDGEPVKHVRFSLQAAADSLGYTFMRAKVEKIDPTGKQIYFDNGKLLSYDYLLIAVGVNKNYSAIPGFEEYGYSVCDDVHAPRLWERLKNFEGGPVVTGAMPYRSGTRIKAPKLMTPCEGPIGEIIFMLDYYLKNKGLRQKSPITVFTPADIFFEDVGANVHKDAEALLKQHDINVITNKTISRIEKDHVVFKDGATMESALTIIIPEYKAHSFIQDAGLGDEEGFIPTDKQMRHLDYPEIFAAGDATALSVPKLGHLAVMQAEIAACMIAKELGGDVEIPEYKPAILCIMNRGPLEATMIYSTYLFGGKIDKTLDGPIPFLMKWGFDFYYNYTLGHMPPKMGEKLLEKHFEKQAEDSI